MSRSIVVLGLLASCAIAACSGGSGDGAAPPPPAVDSGHVGDSSSAADARVTDAPASDSANPATDAPAGGGLTFSCFATTAVPNPNACPAPSGGSGEATFCYRPQWAGVTSVDVYGGFGQATDWKSPFVSLKSDGSGTFTATTPLADGSYTYVFETQGSADNLVKDGHSFLDQYNTKFVPSPPEAPDQRSVSQITIPQGTPAPVIHIKGSVLFMGKPQSCYSIDLEAGENVVGGKVISEHDTANYSESAADGTFDFPVAMGAPYGITIRYPFTLSADAGYPSPASTPSVGIARTTFTPTADITLDPIDIAYPLADYAAMSPTGGSATLPVTFTFSVLAGASASYVSVTSTNIAGNDPAYASKPGTSTSVTWNGIFNGAKDASVEAGTVYYWGAWDQRDPAIDGGTMWVEESLLFPVTFH